MKRQFVSLCTKRWTRYCLWRRVVAAKPSVPFNGRLPIRSPKRKLNNPNSAMVCRFRSKAHSLGFIILRILKYMNCNYIFLRQDAYTLPEAYVMQPVFIRILAPEAWIMHAHQITAAWCFVKRSYLKEALPSRWWTLLPIKPFCCLSKRRKNVCHHMVLMMPISQLKTG